MFGVIPTGFNRKTAEDIRADIIARLALSQPEFVVAPQTVIGQLVDLMSDALAENWEGMEDVYHSFDPTQAEGVRLDQLLAQSARPPRRQASSSVVELEFTGVPGTVIPVTTLVSGTGGEVFQTDSALTLPIGGIGTVTASSQTLGAVTADALTLTTLSTPIAGVTGVTNNAAAIVGNVLETDQEIRARITNENSASTLAQNINGDLQAKLRLIPGVTEAVVYVNQDSTTDANGVPANNFAPVVLGGTDAAIADVIYSTHTSGVSSFGTTEKFVDPDGTGICLPVRFSRPTLIEMGMKVDVRFSDACGCTPDSLTQIRTEIINYWEGASPYEDCSNTIGRDAFASDFYLPVLNVGGIRVESIQLFLVSDPLTFLQTLDVQFNDRITIDPNNIEVNVLT